MKFKNFLEGIEDENTVDMTSASSNIKLRLSELSTEELSDFGEWLSAEISDSEEEYEDTHIHSLDEIMEIVNQLSSEDLSYVDYMLSDTEYDEDDDDVVEGKVSRRFSAKQKNKKKNKKFQLSKAKFRAGAAARKKDNRKNKSKRKKYVRANKASIKAKGKSYAAALKKGHQKKIRR